MEYNQVRPYTYQEKFTYQSFSNYRTPLAHPMGANFREAAAILRYQPLPRLSLNATAIYNFFGTDPDLSSNFGGDVLKNRTGQSTGLFGNVIGQGVENRVLLGSINATYMLKQNLFLDISRTYRKHTLATETPEVIHLTQLSVRMNISRQEFNY